MKKLMFLLVLLLGVAMTSCSFFREGPVVDDYFQQTTLFQCELTYLNEPTWQDTARFKHEYYFVLAYDVYDAQRLFESSLTELANTRNGVETNWSEIPISNRQDYPYRN